MILSLLLAAVALPANAAFAQSADSVVARKFIAHVRREEAKFIAAWRREWKEWRDLGSTDPRYFSIHCHWDEPLLAHEQFHLIRSHHSGRSMCPIWFQERGERGDEAIRIDNGIPPKARQRVRDRRATVLRLLDSAAVLAPANLWVLGQRVRLNVDQDQHERALAVATSECAAHGAICALLEGYVLASAGHRRAAEATFAYAISRMTPAERCRYLDVGAFVPAGLRNARERTSCEERAPINERFWWFADPLFADPGNERLAQHLYRSVLIELKAAVTADEHFDWRPHYGGVAAAEMLIRYGWPNVSYHSRLEDENHTRWLRGRAGTWRDSASNASREYFRPRYMTTVPYEMAFDPGTLRAEDFTGVAAQWNEKRMDIERSWWPMEHIPRAAPIIPLEHQVAAFRRDSMPLVVFATDPRRRQLVGAHLSAYTATLVAMRDPNDEGRASTRDATPGAGGAVAMTLETRPGWQLLSAEFLNPSDDSAAAARARVPATLPPGLDSLSAGEIAFSDPALFAVTGDSLPVSLADATELMLPTTTLRGPERLGVYFEIYGLPADTSTSLTLTIVALDQPGLLRRFGARFGIAESGGGAIAVRWQGDRPGTAAGVEQHGDVTVHTRSIVLNIALLRSGRYALEVTADRAGNAAAARREFVIAR